MRRLGFEGLKLRDNGLGLRVEGLGFGILVKVEPPNMLYPILLLGDFPQSF